MVVKWKLTRAEYDKLGDDWKKEYKADGEEFVLDMSGGEDTGALKRAKDREAELRKTADAKVTELTGLLGTAEAKVTELEGMEPAKRGDIKTLEASWKAKLVDAEKASGEKLGKLTDHIKRSLVDNVAMELATKISTAPKLLVPHIKTRLAADFDGDEPVSRVLDAAGKVSALTLEELGKEFVANKDFAAIIRASGSSGGAGAKPPLAGGAGLPHNQNGAPPNLAAMKPADLAATIKANKDAAAAT